jgi:acyl-CoA synthetase (AMP-forming)/AMP-acid ligase II
MTTTASPIHRSPRPAPPIGPALAVAALRHAAADPDARAVVDGATGETLTRGELAARSAALAAGLHARGVVRGDLVAIAMPNLAWWPVVALGAWRAGAAIEPLSPLWTAEESARVLAGAVPRLAIAFAPYAPHVGGARAAAAPGVELVVVGGDADGATPIGALMTADAGDPTPSPRSDLPTLPLSPSPAARADCRRACASRTATSPRAPLRASSA